MTTKYSEKDIERYAGLAGIRKRPTRFIGSNDSNGLFTCVREPLDNCCDLALAGINDTAHLVVDGESYWVLDNGPGIPVGKKEFADERGRVESLSVLFVVTGLTNAGKNFNSDTISRGAHGEGLKCTNAMSKNFKVWTFRDGKWWTIEYRDAKLFKDVGVGSAPKLPHGLKASKGTVIQFTPDMKLFARGTRLSMTDVRSWCELTSVLIPGFTVKFTNGKGVTRVMRSKDGVKEYLTKRVAELKCNLLRDRIFHISDKVVDVALGFSDTDKASIDCYTNGLRNKDGGEHLRAVYAALEKSLLPYRGKNKYTPTALRDGLLGLVNAKLSTPKFNNQTKDKLLDERGYDLVLPAVLKAFEDFWRKNKSLAAEICQRAAKLHQATYDFQQNKKLMQALKPSKNTKMLLPGKLTASPKCPPHKRELFLVEGDSAGGCHFGTTEVLLANGKTVTFETLVEDFAKGVDHVGLAYDRTNKKSVPFTFFHPRITKRVSEYVELELADGMVWKGTTDHPWLLTNGTYKAASLLTSEDEIQEIPRLTNLAST